MTTQGAFRSGEVVTQISRDGLVVDYLVTEVLAPHQVKVQVYDESGVLTERWRILGPSELVCCRRNVVATRLLRQQNQGTDGAAPGPSRAAAAVRRALITEDLVHEAFRRHGR